MNLADFIHHVLALERHEGETCKEIKFINQSKMRAQLNAKGHLFREFWGHQGNISLSLMTEANKGRLENKFIKLLPVKLSLGLKEEEGGFDEGVERDEGRLLFSLSREREPLPRKDRQTHKLVPRTRKMSR